MPDRILGLLISLVIASMGGFFILILSPQLTLPEKESDILLNDIEGAAIIYKGEEYTLNFKQQNMAARRLKDNKRICQELYKELEVPPFERLVFYRFDKAPIVIKMN